MPAKTSCSDYALYYIHRFPKTEKELRLQLLKKWYPQADIDQTITFLKSKNYVSDRVFAKLYIESELIKKGKAKILVQQKLSEKGIDRHLIQDLLTQYEDEIQEGLHRHLAQEIAHYKQQWLEGIEIVQKLMRKGYRYRDIKHYVTHQEQESD